MTKTLLRPFWLIILSAGILLFIPLAGKAQPKNFRVLVVPSRAKDNQKWYGSPLVSIPMKNKIVDYEKTFEKESGGSREERFERAREWFSKAAPGITTKLDYADREACKLTGKGSFKVVTANNGNYCELRFDISIKIIDSNFSFSTNHYYEKPVEKGVSNDYSKIEYRWWDYRQGKPWPAEDSLLFAGLDSNSRALRATFEQLVAPHGIPTTKARDRMCM